MASSQSSSNVEPQRPNSNSPETKTFQKREVPDMSWTLGNWVDWNFDIDFDDEEAVRALLTNSDNAGNRGERKFVSELTKLIMADRKESQKPKLLLMGLKRSGKSSISNVVFRKMTPRDTIYLSTTTTILKENTQTFMDFQIWDLPGQIDYLDPDFNTESIFGGVGAMIWILDAGDEYMPTISRLTGTILSLRDEYPSIKYSVFIHKTDILPDDVRDDTVRDIEQRVTDDLYDAGIEDLDITYHSTSIYDCTIFEAFSKVMQKLVPQLPIFEALLDQIKATCAFEKVYLFDVLSKIYIASDTTPRDDAAYNVCSDYINLIIDCSEIYGFQREGPAPGDEKAKLLEAHGAESFVSNIKGYALYLREINRNLSFIGISKNPDFDKTKALYDHNIKVLRNLILEDISRMQAVEQKQAEGK